MMENKPRMKVLRGSIGCVLLVSGLLVTIGCGGAGQTTSFKAGQYDGTVTFPGKYTTSVDITVSTSGAISGTCNVLSSTSGAITSRAVVTGSANPQTGEFTAAGMFQCFIPPPPDGSGTGPVTISGSLPLTGFASGPLQVQDSLVTLHGVIGPSF